MNNRHIKKLVSGLLTLIITFSTLIGCSPSGSSAHEHTFASFWVTNEEYHWHPSTCGHDVQGDKGRHEFTSETNENGDTVYTCSICNYSFSDGNKDTYTVTWENYDGAVLEVDEGVPYGATPTYDGATPARESSGGYDYTFAGWSPEPGPVTGDATYTAVFSSEEITYTIDFDLNGGTSSSYKGPIEVTTFSKDIFFFDCVKEGWSFRGWEYNNEKIFDEKGNQLKNVTLVDNMVFKAIYAQTVKLTITTNMPEAGTITGEGEYPYKTYVDVSVKPNQGYKFVGWYYQNTLLSNEEVYKYLMWDKDVTLEARFGKDDFNLRIYSNNEDYGLVLLKSNSVIDDYLPEYTSLEEYTSEVTIAAYSKSDVRFLGWYDENNQLVTTNAVYTFVMPNYDYTLEAKWNYFTINYNLNGGTNDPDNPNHYSIDDGIINLQDPTKEGYEFVAWKYNDEIIDTIDVNLMQDITLEAVWSSYEYEIREDDNGIYAVIIGYDDSITDVIIPENVILNGEEIPVKEISQTAFKDNQKVRSITVSNKVTTIDEYAFAGCTSLESIYIPDSVTTIGSHAFSECSNLTTVTISEGSQLTSIGSEAFYKCTSLTSIYIPDSVTTIGDDAFYNCSNLTAVTISETSQLTTIGEYAFHNCPSLTSIYIPNSVTTINSYAFYGCSNLTTVTFGETSQLTTIGEYAFYNCSSLASIYIPDSVTTIGNCAFYNCSKLKTVTISENSQLTSIGSCAFYKCTSLTSIYIPDSVTTIGDDAFYNCSNLTTVTFGENSQLTSIGYSAFEGCTSLTSIYIPDSVTTIGSGAFHNCSNLTIYCEASSKPSGWHDSWNNSDLPVVWNSYKGIHGNLNGFEYIAYHDNEGNPYIVITGYSGSNTDVVIPEYIEVNGEQIAVKEISNSAFEDNTKITSIYIPDSVTTIGSSAFYGCSNLTIYCEASSKPSGWDSQWNSSKRPVIWNSYKGIYGDFNGFEYIAYHDNEGNPYIAITGYSGSNTDVVIPEYIEVDGEQIVVKEISNSAFEDNTKITLIYIPDSVTTIGDDAFYNCPNLTIYCEASSKPNGWDSWWNSSYRPVVWNSYKGIHGNLNGFEYIAYHDNEGNPYIVITGYNGFDTDVVIPEYIEVNGEQIAVKEINDKAFYDNDTIKSVTIPDSVTTIGDSAFYSCSNLTTVTISENSQLTTIGEYAFGNCSSLTSIYIPDSVTTIGSGAFHNCSNLTICCEASSKPSGWDSQWNSSKRPVIWNSYKGIYGDFNGFEYIAYHDNEGNPYIAITGYNGFDTDVVIPEYIEVNGEQIAVKEINDKVFYYNDTITSITIPDSVTTIGDSAFYSCSNLTTVTISENSQLTTIGSSAFEGCSSLTSIYIPDSVTTIGELAFYECSNLTTVTISEDSQLTSIGSEAFRYCSSLTSIYIPDSVTTIGSSAFEGCSNLTTVTISENSQLTSIGSWAFYNCSSLTSIYIPDSVTTIGSSAFYGCSNLTIYCEASSQPSGWDSSWSSWNSSNRPVVWNCTYEEYLDAIA